MHLRSQGAGCARDSLAGKYPAANASAPRGPAVEGGGDATDSAAARQFSPSALAADIAAQDTARPCNLGLQVLEPLPKPRRPFAPSSSAVRPTTSGLNQGKFDGDSPSEAGGRQNRLGADH